MFHGDFIGTDTAHPERPLLNTLPLIRALSAGSFRSRHLLLPSDTTILTSSVLNPPKVCKKSGEDWPVWTPQRREVINGEASYLFS